MILVLSLTFISCSKQPEKIRKQYEALSGKWNYSQSFISDGWTLIYKSTKNLNQWILFTRDGSLSSNMPGFKKATSYQIVDSLKVKINFPTEQPNARLFFYTIDSYINSLSLSPADIICIEGCGDIFERAQTRN